LVTWGPYWLSLIEWLLQNIGGEKSANSIIFLDMRVKDVVEDSPLPMNRFICGIAVMDTPLTLTSKRTLGICVKVHLDVAVQVEFVGKF
jgi:hypothetical protein